MHFQNVFIPLPSKDYCLTPFILWSRISDRLWHLNKYEACLRQNCETLHAQLSLGFLQILNNQSWTVGHFVHYLDRKKTPCKLFSMSVTQSIQMMSCMMIILENICQYQPFRVFKKTNGLNNCLLSFRRIKSPSLSQR